MLLPPTPSGPGKDAILTKQALGRQAVRGETSACFAVPRRPAPDGLGRMPESANHHERQAQARRFEGLPGPVTTLYNAPLVHGPVTAKVMPGVWMLKNSQLLWKVAPQNSDPRKSALNTAPDGRV
jgi:hypothetical protein